MDGWMTATTLPPMEAGEIQVWRLWLDDPEIDREQMLGRAYSALTDAERDRAGRMRVGAPREEFVAGRGFLRLLLGAILGEEPRTLVLETGVHGKPELAGGRGLDFNVAHSRGMVLIAVSQTGTVGVDVEFVDEEVEWRDVAPAALHRADVKRVEAKGPAEFFRCWTRKEAVVKADGRGLTISPGEFEVGGEDAVAVGRFFVQRLEVGPTHVAAVASSVADVLVRRFAMGPGMGFEADFEVDNWFRRSN